MPRERQLEVEQCLQNCLASSGCLLGTVSCGRECDSMCFSTPSSVAVDLVIDTIFFKCMIVKPHYRVKRKPMTKQGLTGNIMNDKISIANQMD